MSNMRRVFAIIALAAAAVPCFGQVFGTPVTDAPQHALVAGFAIGPTSKDFSVVGGIAEKIPGAAATYSYTSVSVIPSIAHTAGRSSLAVTPVTTTGIKQILYQNGRFTLAADGSAGVTLPTASSNAFNFSAIGSADFIWRLTRILNSKPGGSNNYITLAPQFTQVSGSNGGVVIGIGLAWIHSAN